MKRYFGILLLFAAHLSWAQSPGWKGKFEQLEQILPTPNEYRSGSGAPGPRYWQQKADYIISVELNDDNQSISGKETITYHNNSPDVLRYLWLQLDQNIQSNDNSLKSTATDEVVDSAAAKTFASRVSDFVAGFKIAAVNETSGKPLKYFINNTMMR
ncbi:MAG TPA: M1 family peptidase, partial [Chryseosolibacter sp.]|nr:M1 family peptidase [Chryseosolibacter sp.]